MKIHYISSILLRVYLHFSQSEYEYIIHLIGHQQIHPMITLLCQFVHFLTQLHIVIQNGLDCHQIIHFYCRMQRSHQVL